jgi:hypothetical protein
MTSKIYSSAEKNGCIILISVILLNVLSCVPKIVRPTAPPRQPVPIKETAKPSEKPAPVYPSIEKQTTVSKPTEKDVPASEIQSPRMMASLALTQQARQYIENQDADSAIRILERAVVVDPLNGQNYYYLSEAWLLKGNIDQSVKFNELAEIHLADQPRWVGIVSDQKKRIFEQAGIRGE